MFSAEVLNQNGVAQGTPRGAKTRKISERRKPSPKRPIEDNRDRQKAEQEREGLIRYIVVGIWTHNAGGYQTTQHCQSCPGETLPKPMASAGKQAIKAVYWPQQKIHRPL